MRLRSGKKYSVLENNDTIIVNYIGYYLKNFNYAKNRKEQKEIVLKLFYYLYHNLNFLKQNNLFYYVCLKKLCEIYTENKFDTNSALWLGINNYIKKFFDKDYDDISLKILKYKIFTHDYNNYYCNNHMLCQCYECRNEKNNINCQIYINDINKNLNNIKLINRRIMFKKTNLQTLCYNKIKELIKKSKYDKIKTLKHIKKINLTYFFKNYLIKELYPETCEPVKTRSKN